MRHLLGAHGYGFVSVRLTSDARYLATLSADPKHQTLAIWDWTSPSEQPLAFTQLDSKLMGNQNHIAFREDEYFQLMSNSESHVIFYDWVISHALV